MFVCGKARMRSPTAAEIAPRLLGVTADLVASAPMPTWFWTAISLPRPTSSP
jgi:predicted protein tyrosine phosphatase